MRKQASTTHFFYQNGKLVTVNQGGQQRAIFRTADMPLAEQQSDGTNELFATDRSNSVLAVQDDDEEPEHAFTPYGHDPTLRSTGALLGFNGESFEPATTCYQLGNGYRTYSPALMRFHSPDSWSPFEQGGLNAYSYCNGDPINFADPDGHVVTLIPAAPALSMPKIRPHGFLGSFGKNRIVRRFKVEHYESSTSTTLETAGTGRNATTQAVTSTRRTLQTTELFEVIVDPHIGDARVHVTRTNLDSYLEASNTLQQAQATNALGDPAIAVDPAFLNNLENRRLGLAMIGESLARRAADPLDLTAYTSGAFRVSTGASATRGK